MIPLTLARPGEIVTIMRISGNDEVKNHLASLGCTVSSKLIIVNKLGKNIIVQVKESRLALDEKMANRILVMEE